MLYESNMSEAFPELDKGLEILNIKEDYVLNYLEFFALCFYRENIEIPEKWRFSNKEKAIISKIMELVLVTERDAYNEMIIYRIGRDVPLMANNVSRIINSNNDQEYLINNIYDSLPIHKTCDLKFKGTDILELTTLKNAEIIGEIIDDITYQVITNKLLNDYDEIKNYTMNVLGRKYDQEE